MSNDELIPNPSPELLALARKFKLAGYKTPIDERAVIHRCEGRKCKRPGRCTIRRCQRMNACQLAVLAGWPWPLPGREPGTGEYRVTLEQHIAYREAYRSVFGK